MIGDENEGFIRSSKGKKREEKKAREGERRVCYPLRLNGGITVTQ